MIQYEKIILVIDEPKRDFDQFLFLATKLFRKNYQIYLISLYNYNIIKKLNGPVCISGLRQS